MLILFIIMLLVSMVIFFRLRFLYYQNHNQRIISIWHSELAHFVLSDEEFKCRISPRNRLLFLNEWNNMFGIIKGDNLNKLRKLGRKMGLDKYAILLLKKRNIRNTLIAIMTLGHMREAAAIETLLEMLNHRNAIISIAAARSLLLIDDRYTIDKIIETMNSRTDWPWSNVSHMLKLGSRHVVCNKLETLLKASPVKRQPGVLRHLETCGCLQSSRTVVDLLATANEDRVASTCLHIINDPRALPDIRKFLDFPRWHVRMHAATALGRLGNADDAELLLALTSDPQWWVRYRAAQALVTLPGMNHDEITKLAGNCTDRYARDIITHVLAEQSL